MTLLFVVGMQSVTLFLDKPILILDNRVLILDIEIRLISVIFIFYIQISNLKKV